MGMALRFATLHISAMREVKTLITFLVAWAPAPTANTTSRSTRGNRTGGLHFGQNRNKGSSAARMGPLETQSCSNLPFAKSPLCEPYLLHGPSLNECTRAESPLCQISPLQSARAQSPLYKT